MKRITLTICTVAILFAACNSETKSDTAKDTTAVKEVTIKEEPWVPIDSATSMKAMMEAATPGEPHKMLASSTGTWNAEVSMWMSPDAPPATSKGTATNKMVMDGRYQISEFKGDMMGSPFTGMSTTAYDNVKKKFVSTWIDNWGTGIMQMEGPWDESSKSMTLSGKMIEPSTKRECDMKESFKIVDDNTQLMEMWGPDPKTGKPYKTMEIKFTRKK
jgi:Protein of unknown function (DUF1579)